MGSTGVGNGDEDETSVDAATAADVCCVLAAPGGRTGSSVEG